MTGSWRIYRELIAAALLALLCIGAASAQSSQSIVLTLEFRNLPKIPTCQQTQGSGSLKASNQGRKVTYNMRGLETNSLLVCQFDGGGSFEVHPGFLFDHYIHPRHADLKNGGSAKIRIVYKYKRTLRLVDPTYIFSTKGKKFKIPGSSLEVTKAMLPDREFKTGRWKK